MYFRLRLMHRLGLLGPLLRIERQIETWAAGSPARPRVAFQRVPRHQA
jgi:hypothetical protein